MKNVLTEIIPSRNINPSYDGAAIDTSQVIYASLQVVATGTTPTFSVKLQASNDVPPTGTMGVGTWTPTNWSDISGATVSFTDVGAKMIPVTLIGYRYIRVVETYTSGTGTFSAQFFGICV